MSKSQHHQSTLNVNSGVEYTDTWYRHLAREIYWSQRIKEDYLCPDCGRGRGRVYKFHVHHIDRDPSNNAADNLIGLCHRCHIWRHRTGPTMSGLDIEEWKAGFSALGSEARKESINSRVVYALVGGSE